MAKLGEVEERVKTLEESLLIASEPGEEVTKEFVKPEVESLDRQLLHQLRVDERLAEIQRLDVTETITVIPKPQLAVVSVEERDRETIALLESLTALPLIHEPSSLARLRDVAKILLKKWKES